MDKRGRTFEPGPSGYVCPICAGFKWPQSRTCMDCFIERARRELSRPHSARCPCPDCRARERAERHKRRVKAGEIKGTGTGRPQPSTHPWRSWRAG